MPILGIFAMPLESVDAAQCPDLLGHREAEVWAKNRGLIVRINSIQINASIKSSPSQN